MTIDEARAKLDELANVLLNGEMPLRAEWDAALDALVARAREEGAREERAQAIKHLLSHAEWVEQHQGKEAADAVRLGCDRVARCGDALEEARKVQP
jgi:hypothetical protein